MNRKKFVLVIVSYLMIIPAVICWADELFVEDNNTDNWQSLATPLYTSRILALHSGFLRGYTKYHINFDGGASELEFPLDVPVWGVKGILGYKKSSTDRNETARLIFTYLTNTSRDAGKMRDSDWMDADGNEGVDIYSESESELNAEMMSLDYCYNLYPDRLISFGPLIGYQIHKFKYRIYNTVQIGYGPYSGIADASVSTKTLDYTIRYESIYLGVALISGDVGKLTFNAGFGYSPWAKAEDRDDHVQRSKLSEGDTRGTVYIFKGDTEWRFAEQWALQLSGQYQQYNTDGNQHQSFYDDPSLADVTIDVDDEISSGYYHISAGLAYFF